MWQLYRSTSHYLGDSEDYYRQRKIERDNLRVAVGKKLAKDFADEVAAYFEFMPEIYFQSYSAADIVAHIRFFRSYLERRYVDGGSRGFSCNVKVSIGAVGVHRFSNVLVGRVQSTFQSPARS